ncbi:MAG: NAD(P)H-hydrate epimerase [Agathobaculum sp.]|jgi:NAD(P)H-hydrate epimerase|uniref:NAD(P)H-hydrate epimerase n=1 Tax=Agathobaculum sp. TaxID=2048138 RepID=UPI003D8DAF74
MITVSAAQMKEIERQADAHGLCYLQMMENAGEAAFSAMRAAFPDARRIVVFAGKGNNGGDGFVVARRYAETGAAVTIVLCEGMPVTEDAQTNFSRLQNVSVLPLDKAAPLPPADLLVDALYGTGFHGALRESGRKAARLMNESSAPVCALDLPSGMNADTGEIASGAVQADLTAVFHRFKHGHAVPAAQKQCGRLLLADIGIPEY